MLEPGSSWHVPGFFGFGFEVDWLERSVELDSGRTLNWWDVAEPERARRSDHVPAEAGVRPPEGLLVVFCCSRTTVAT